MVHLALRHVSPRLIRQLVDEVAITGVLLGHPLLQLKMMISLIEVAMLPSLLKLEVRVDQPSVVDLGASASSSADDHHFLLDDRVRVPLGLKRFVNARKGWFSHDHICLIEECPAGTYVFKDIGCGKSSSLLDSYCRFKQTHVTLGSSPHFLTLFHQLLSLPFILFLSCYLIFRNFFLLADKAK